MEAAAAVRVLGQARVHERVQAGGGCVRGNWPLLRHQFACPGVIAGLTMGLHAPTNVGDLHVSRVEQRVPEESAALLQEVPGGAAERSRTKARKSQRTVR